MGEDKTVQKRLLLKEVLFILALAATTLLLFNQALLGEAVFCYGNDDGTLILYPLRVLFARGEVSWTSLLFCGFPLFAEPHMALFYPLNWLFFKIIPIELAFSYLIVFEFFLAGLFTYLFARLIGLKELPSLISALAFSLFGFLPSYLGNSTVIHSSIWLPSVFYFLELTLRKKRFTFSLLAGLSLSLQILAGFPQMAFITFLGASFYYFLRLKQETKENKESLQKKREIRLSIILYLVFFLFALGLAAVQILPTFELTQFSGREAGLSFARATEGSWSPANFLTFIFPYFFKGLPAQVGIPALNYLGLLPFIFVLFSLLKRERKEVKAFWYLTAFAFFLALGYFNPFYHLIYLLPGFQFFRVPSRFLLLSQFSLSLLGGFGFAFFLENFQPEKQKKLAKILTASLVLIFCFLFLLSVFLSIAKPWLIELGKEYVKEKFYGQPYHPYPLKHYYQRLENFYLQAQTTLNFTSPKIFTPAILSLLALFIIWLRAGKKIKAEMLGKIALLVVLADLVFFFDQGNLFPTFKREAFLKKPAASKILSADNTIFRIYSYPHWEYRASELTRAVNRGLYEPPYRFARETLQPNLNIIDGFESLSGYLGLFPRQVSRLVNLWEMEGSLSDSERLSLLSGRYLKLLGWLNVKYLLTRSSLKSEGLENVYESKEVKIYRNKYFQPRFFLASRYKVLKNEEETLARITSPGFQPRQSVFLKEKPPLNSYKPFKKSSIKLSKYSSTRLKLKVNLDGNGFLVITNSFYPGWKAEINGKESLIYQANYAFQAVPLSQGESIVELKFEPFSLKMGVILSLFSLLVGTVIIFWEYSFLNFIKNKNGGR